MELIKTIKLLTAASSDTVSDETRRAAIEALVRPPFIASAPTTKREWSVREVEEFYRKNPIFVRHLQVKHE